MNTRRVRHLRVSPAGWIPESRRCEPEGRDPVRGSRTPKVRHQAGIASALPAVLSLSFAFPTGELRREVAERWTEKRVHSIPISATPQPHSRNCRLESL